MARSQRMSRVALLVCLALSALPHHVFPGHAWVRPVELVALVMVLTLLTVQMRESDRQGPYTSHRGTLYERK